MEKDLCHETVLTDITKATRGVGQYSFCYHIGSHCRNHTGIGSHFCVDFGHLPVLMKVVWGGFITRSIYFWAPSFLNPAEQLSRE